jgi:hypothetical protein
MAIFTQTISAADILAGLTTDTTKWAGANIANLDAALSTSFTTSGERVTRKVGLVTDAIFTASGGTLENQRFGRSLLETVGTWYFKGKWTTNNAVNDTISWMFINQDTDNQIYLAFKTQSAATLVQITEAAGTTTLITGDTISDTDSHYCEVTRDVLGNIELEMDGTSKGTATDDFCPIPNYSFLRCYAGGGTSVGVIEDAYLIMEGGI